VSEAAPEEPSDAQETRRSRWPAILVTGATVLAFVSLFSTWARVQAPATDRWVTLADEMLEDPEIQQALSGYLVDELYSPRWHLGCGGRCGS